MQLCQLQRETLLVALATARLLREQLPAPILERLNLPAAHELAAAAKLFRPTIWGRSESVAEYANLLFLTQYTEMYRQLLAIGAQLPLLRRLLRSLADF